MPNQNIKDIKSPIRNAIKTNEAEVYMVDTVLVISPDNLVRNVQKRLIAEVEKFDTISYIYVTNKLDKLIGVLSIQELFASKKSLKIVDVMIKKPITVRRTTNKERVAIIALKHNLKAVPIVDKHNKFLGIVPSDVILSILNNTHLRDTLYAAGIYSTEKPMKSLMDPSVFFHARKRLPWLLIGLVGSMATALIVNSFNTLMQSFILLAAFIPTIMYMSDAVGNQTQSIFIKSITIDSNIDQVGFFFREVRLSLLLGMILSVGVFLFASLFWKNPVISFIFSISLIVAIIAASTLAVLLPIIFRKVNVDPAVATGPLASVLRDIFSLSIYFSFATLLLRLYG